MSEERTPYVTKFIGGTANFNVPTAGISLAARKLELDRTQPGPEIDSDMMAELYRVLADEFDAIGQTIVAGACRKSAERWGHE